MAINPQSISNFKSGFVPVPLNRYHAIVTRGKILSTGIVGSRELALRCESAELPGRTHTTSDQRLYGPIRKIPYNSGYIDTTLTFMCSENTSIAEKRFFDEWQDAIQDPESFDIAYYDDLVGNIKVEVLDEQNFELYSVDMLEAFPLNVSAISVGWGTNTDYMKFSVTFSYRKWKRSIAPNEVRLGGDKHDE
jgi:hypothetical protein